MTGLFGADGTPPDGMAVRRLAHDDDSPLAGTEVHHLHSEHVGDDFKIFVGHCGSSEAAAPIPLYLADANGMFGSAVDMVRLMQLSAFLPPMLVIGIGYPVGAIGETVGARTRDLTPTSDPLVARITPAVDQMGGAGCFLAFIRDELQPWVRSHYEVDAEESVYFGHSLAGLFGAWVLLTEPDTFGCYGIGSPSLWWHDDVIFEHEAAYAEAHDDLAARVFLSVGAFEDHEGRQREASRLPAEERAKAGLRHIDMVADTERLAEVLRSRRYPSLELTCQFLPDEFHVTVAHLNLSRALRHLFDAPG